MGALLTNLTCNQMKNKNADILMQIPMIYF